MEMLRRVMGDVRKRLTECLERNGGHLNDDIFLKGGLLFSMCQIVKRVKLKVKKSKFFYMNIVFLCDKTKFMKAITLHDVFKIARFTDAPCIYM